MPVIAPIIIAPPAIGAHTHPATENAEAPINIRTEAPTKGHTEGHTIQPFGVGDIWMIVLILIAGYMMDNHFN